MKKELNDKIKNATTTVNEVFLFRAMADLFNTQISRGAYIEEIHGQKGKVEFTSSIAIERNVRVELGDQIIFTYDAAIDELRMCILQAKKKKKGLPYLGFQADILQWELLKDKPNITDKSRFNFPSNILSCGWTYESITAYGIFYIDANGSYDFQFSIPRLIEPKTVLKGRIYERNKNRTFWHRCSDALRQPLNNICISNFKEAICACSIDVFELSALAARIGAPILRKGRPLGPDGSEIGQASNGQTPTGIWAYHLLRYILSQMRENSSSENAVSVIRDITYAIGEMIPNEYREISREMKIDETPAVMAIITDSSKFGWPSY